MVDSKVDDCRCGQVCLAGLCKLCRTWWGLPNIIKHDYPPYRQKVETTISHCRTEQHVVYLCFKTIIGPTVLPDVSLIRPDRRQQCAGQSPVWLTVYVNINISWLPLYRCCACNQQCTKYSLDSLIAIWKPKPKSVSLLTYSFSITQRRRSARRIVMTTV